MKLMRIQLCGGILDGSEYEISNHYTSFERLHMGYGMLRYEITDPIRLSNGCVVFEYVECVTTVR